MLSVTLLAFALVCSPDISVNAPLRECTALLAATCCSDCMLTACCPFTACVSNAITVLEGTRKQVSCVLRAPEETEARRIPFFVNRTMLPQHPGWNYCRRALRLELLCLRACSRGAVISCVGSHHGIAVLGQHSSQRYYRSSATVLQLMRSVQLYFSAAAHTIPAYSDIRIQAAHIATYHFFTSLFACVK
jgi:hypothetical protein